MDFYLHVADMAGNLSNSPAALYALDTSGPSLFATTPDDGNNAAPGSDLVMMFAETVSKGKGYIRIVNDTYAASTFVAAEWEANYYNRSRT